jgi:hypothetical protein
LRGKIRENERKGQKKTLFLSQKVNLPLILRGLKAANERKAGPSP